MEGSAFSLRKIIEKDDKIFQDIKKDAEKNTYKFSKNKRINFPWEVLIASAEK